MGSQVGEACLVCSVYTVWSVVCEAPSYLKHFCNVI